MKLTGRRRPKPITAPFLLAIAWLIRFFTINLRRRTQAEAKPLNAVQSPAKVGLSNEIIRELPQASHHFNGRAMEPMNLILIGDEEAIRQAFAAVGWYEADQVSFLSLLKSQLAILLGRSYLHGPVTPLYVGQKVHTLAVQKPTVLRQFKERHHARFWTTDYHDTNGAPVWIGQASLDVDIKYDIDARSDRIFRAPPAHQIDPDLDAERDVLITDLVSANVKLNGYVQLHEAHTGINGLGDSFHTDGRAAVLSFPAAKREPK